MTKRFLVLLFALTASLPLSAQDSLGGGLFQQSTRTIRFFSASPATCATTRDNIGINTTTGLLGWCSAANTWSYSLGSGGGAFTGQVNFSNGTATEPSWGWTSDDDTSGTGMFRGCANCLSFATNGVERWIVNASGALNPFVSNTYDIGGTTTIRDIGIGRNAVFSGATSGTSTLHAPTIASTADITLPGATGTLATLGGTEVFTSKSISLGSNTVTSTIAQLNTAVTDADVATLAGAEALTNKTFNLSSNTFSGTTTQFNTALSDNDFATLAGPEPLSNKTLVAPTNEDVNRALSAVQNVTIRTTDAFCANCGGSIGFMAKYNGAGAYANFAGIAGRKENSTDGNIRGYLSLSADDGSTGLVERMRIDSNGIVGFFASEKCTTAQFDKTSSTTLSAITGLSANVLAGVTYVFELNVFTTSNVAGGIKVAIGGSSTATSIIYEGALFSGGVSTAPGTARASSMSTAVCDLTAVTAGRCEVVGTMVVNAAGTLEPFFAQNASNGSASSVLIGSCWRVRRVN